MIVLSVIVLPLLSCFDGPWTDIRDGVPYRNQLQTNYCAVACVQMWAIWDEVDESLIPQDLIADNMHINYYSNGVVPEDIEEGVGMFTGSSGYLRVAPPSNFGQDDCIAGCIASIKDFRLAIVPFKRGTHAVLAFGYQWHYDGGQRVADKMFYHDPDERVGPNKAIVAVKLKTEYFLPDAIRDSFWVVIGRYKNSTDGTAGYNVFIAEGGTFYGGPLNYDPSQPIN
jgi:hypothetical protein